MKFVTLNNGVKMPILGFGVYQITDLAECERCVLDAINAGYRSIDTAQAYGNEEAVGKAVKKCSVPREELFITTKVWISNGGYEKAKNQLKNLCGSCSWIISTWYLSISLLMTTMAHIVRWNRLIGKGKFEQSV